MKLYTRRGDAGETDLFGGVRVRKDALRVACIGTVDELNAAVGLCLAAAADGSGGAAPHRVAERIAGPLRVIQSRLFEVGADLATPEDSQGQKKPGAAAGVSAAQVAELEAWVDAAAAGVPAMTCFVLPGGAELSARLHVARTVCRRAERLCVALAEHETVNGQVVVYLNRLGDLLFAMARLANHTAGVADVPWVAGNTKQ